MRFLLPNYIKVAFRNMRRDKMYSAVNILGVAVGLASVLIIGWYISYEAGYDSGYPDAERIYRITVDVEGENRMDRFASSSPPIGPAMKEALPEVEQYARLRVGNTQLVRRGENRYYETKILYADSTFFDLLKLPFVEGSPASSLSMPASVVLSYEMARKYFPDGPALGKSLTFNGSDIYTVTGVLSEDSPRMHLEPAIILPFRDFVSSYPQGDYEDWGWVSFYTYVRLADGAVAGDVELKAATLSDRLAGPAADRITLRLQPVRDIHLRPGLMGEIGQTVNRSYLIMLAVAAFLILIISAFNFMNLATARSVRRGLEVGVRKVLGADRKQLISRYLGETVVQSLSALLVACLLAVLFYRLWGTELFPGMALSQVDVELFLPLLVALSVVTGICAGLYPAILLTGTSTAEILKNKTRIGAGGNVMRRALVIAQFTATIVLLIGSISILNQLDYLRSKDLGFNEEQLVVIPMNSDEVRTNFAPLRDAMLQLPGTKGVTAGRLALDGGYGTVSFSAEGHTGQTIRMRLYPVYFDFTEVLGMELVEGRGFSEDFPADTAEGFILNESAVRMLGWEGEAVGKNLEAADYATGHRQVVGVVKDFHYTPLHEEVAPLAMFVRDNGMHFIYARIAQGSISQSLQGIEEAWNQRLPGYPLDYWFLDSRLDSQYRKEMQFSSLIRVFSAIAMIIACFGLFAMASLIAEGRRKEVGIRKVHGATVAQIVWMMAAGFLKPVMIGFILAIPVAYLSVNTWLENFAYRVEPGVGVFLAAGILAMTISLLTVGGQAFNAATVNPVDSLNSE